MVRNASFPKEEIDNERSVILQELQMYEDNPQLHIFEIAQRAIFQAESGLNIPIIGTRETLANIDRDKLVDYYARMYKNPISIEIGDVEQTEAQMLLPKKFALATANADRSDLLVPRKGVNQANMTLTGLLHFDDPIRAYHDLDLYGGVMSGFTGRLFDTVREKNGLVYNVSLYYQIFSCGTVWYNIYAALEPSKIEKARKLIIGELTRPVSTEDIEFAKNKILGQYNLYYDNKTEVSSIVINSTMNHLNYAEILSNYEKHIEVSAHNLNRFIASAQFDKSKLVAIIPEK